MLYKFGFVLLTHNNPTQVFKLIDRLNKIYEFPPIALHHDFSKSQLNTEDLTSNVLLVKDYVTTSWGGYSLIEATIKALRILFQKASPDFYTVISGSDYPFASASDVSAKIKKQQAEVYIKAHEISFSNSRESKWKSHYYNRYCSVKLLIHRKSKNTINQITFFKNPRIVRFFNPFNDSFKCYGGEFWHTASRKAAMYLLDYQQSDPQGLIKHYKNVKIPDESFFQTVYKNSGLTCAADNLRYIDWSDGLPHPKLLTYEDKEKIESVAPAFIRKVCPQESKRLLNWIDEKT